MGATALHSDRSYQEYLAYFDALRRLMKNPDSEEAVKAVWHHGVPHSLRRFSCHRISVVHVRQLRQNRLDGRLRTREHRRIALRR